MGVVIRQHTDTQVCTYSGGVLGRILKLLSGITSLHFNNTRMRSVGRARAKTPPSFAAFGRIYFLEDYWYG